MKIEHLFYLSRLDVFGAIVAHEVTWSAQVAKETHTSYSHTLAIVREFERVGLVTNSKEWGKRNTMIQVTEKVRGCGNI